MAKKTIDDDVKNEYSKVIKKLEKRGYTINDIDTILKGLEQQNNYQKKSYRLGHGHTRFLLFGDTHMGNINFDQKFYDFMVKQSEKEKVDYCLCTGDIVDGWYQNRPSSIFEQNAIGFDQQFKMAVKNLNKLPAKLLYITGNHSYNTYVRGAGIEIGPYLEKEVSESKYLGNGEGDVLFGKSLMRLLHPDGGTASYALSYRSQKIIDAFNDEDKPHVLGIGHFHKAEYLFYDNVHAFQTGTLEAQTKFMKGKGIPAHKGFWIIDLHNKANGQVDKIVPQFYPSYR